MCATPTISSPPDFLRLLAHDLRWQLLQLLSYSDYRVQELVALVERPMNLVSYHLKQLRQYELVHERRSSADGRDVYYSLDLERLHTLYQQGGQQLHPILGNAMTSTPTGAPHDNPLRVLFLCTHNSARSLMAEALLREVAGNRAIEVHSAGDEPSAVHPLTLQVLAAEGINSQALRSKHMNEFENQHFDYVVTVCDRVREHCPVLPGDVALVHWSFADPAAVQGSDEERYGAFADTAQRLRVRIEHLLRVIDHDAATVESSVA